MGGKFDPHCFDPNGYVKHGLLLPLFPDFEHRINYYFRGIIYLLLIVYFFVGVAIASDYFMEAITCITCLTKNVTFNGKEKVVVAVRVWNETVANLTLMALGSSAPEILLSLIETSMNHFQSGELGPSTIVGSAAYNLLAINALCIISIPKGETKRIRAYRVFCLTSVFSVLAYVWMAFVVLWSSPYTVDAWEAVLTLTFFPVFVSLAYWADQRFCVTCKRVHHQTRKGLLVDPETGSIETEPGEENAIFYDAEGNLKLNNVKHYYSTLRKIAELGDEEVAHVVATKLGRSKRRSMLWYRIEAVREMTGSQRLLPMLSNKLELVYDSIEEAEKNQEESDPICLKIRRQSVGKCIEKSIIEFRASEVAVPKNVGIFSITVVRKGRSDNSISVGVVSVNVDAKGGRDYEEVDMNIKFEPFQHERKIPLKIFDNREWHSGVGFTLHFAHYNTQSDRIGIGFNSQLAISIMDDENSSSIHFTKSRQYARDSNHKATVPILRKGNVEYETTVTLAVKKGSLPTPKNFEEQEKVLTFFCFEKQKYLEVPLLDIGEKADDQEVGFDIQIISASGSWKIGSPSSISLVITSDDRFEKILGKALQEQLDVASSKEVDNSIWKLWKEQLQSSIQVLGGENDTKPSFLDYFMHCIFVFWKVPLSVIIFPPTFLGGYPCFLTSLIALSMMTAVISDASVLFGCFMGIPAYVTAITVLAIGTGFPDTFASRVAAISDKTADNAIGNVTGSNTVNVFLGLGLPWLMSIIYHFFLTGEKFCVPAAGLYVSLICYGLMALLAVALLAARRFLKLFGQAELGGPTLPKILSSCFMLSLWILFIVFIISFTPKEQFGPNDTLNECQLQFKERFLLSQQALNHSHSQH